MSARTIELVACTRCRRALPGTLEFFGAKPAKRNGLNSHCKDCVREYSRRRQAQRRSDPVERARVVEEKRRHLQSPKGREWKRRQTFIDNQKRRQRNHPAAAWDWSWEQWQACVASWGGACAYCGAVTTELVHDHFIPLADPQCPGTVPHNVVPACPRCNGRKATKHGEAWASPAALVRIRSYFAIASREET